MLIEGPIKIGVIDKGDEGGTELNIDFTETFKGLELSAQGEEFHRYVREIGSQLMELPEGDLNRPGMLTVQQIAEQLLPHVVTGELALEETIVIELAPEAHSVSLASLLN